jgi:hypothetical protein
VHAEERGDGGTEALQHHRHVRLRLVGVGLRVGARVGVRFRVRARVRGRVWARAWAIGLGLGLGVESLG